tara:strand:- start:1481 stop:3664 length:2184 start_codon:yes stop_codon:yes gene_type:complete
MSDIKTDYATFDVIDYKNQEVLSSYNLSITPLWFKARIPNTEMVDSRGGEATPLNDAKVTFDFGDGTFGHDLTSRHVFAYPGQYTVRMIMRDCNNNAILGSYSTDINIYDYFTNTFTVTWNDGAPTANLSLSAGQFSQAITVNSQSPAYQDFQDIFFSVSGADYNNYFNVSDSSYSHLKKYWSVYRKNYIDSLSSYEYVPIEKVSLSSSNVYVRLSSGTIINCLSTSLSSVHVGSSGVDIIYFKTEEQNTPINISFFKDRNNIFSNSITGYKNNNYTNNFTITLSSVVGATSQQTLNEIMFSSNGITAENDEISSFNVSPIQYKGLGVPFILTPKNTNNYTMKALSAGDSTIKFEVLSSTGEIIDPSNYTIQSLSATLTAVDTDFWYRGLFTFNDTLSTHPGALTLSAQCIYENVYTNLTASNTGSITLTCYPKNYYDFYKHNENFDFEQTIKDLRFQEILLDKDIFFSDFIGTIFGDVSSNYDVLGKKIYEKIFNFTQNTGDIDLCGITELVGMSNIVSEDGIIFDRSRAQEPQAVKRFLDILSINYNKFRGTKNKFDENFDPQGHTTKEIYGKNLGPKIESTLAYEITAGSDLVAYERFSNTYTRLNTFQPLCALSGAAWSSSGNANTYMLSDFSTEVSNTSGGPYWGWPLVLPSSYTMSTITNKYYDFYTLSAVYDDTILNGLIDYTTGQTTVNYTTPLSALEGNENIFDILVRNSLFSSLSLF